MEISSYYSPKALFHFRKKNSPSGVKMRGRYILSKVYKPILLIFLVLFILILALGVVVGIPLYGLYKDAVALESEATSFRQAAKEQDLSKMELSLENLRTGVVDFSSKYESRMRLIKNLPVVKGYYDDGVHALKAADYGLELGTSSIKLIKPFAGELGFKMEGVEPVNLTNQERLIKIITILPQLGGEVDNISQTAIQIDNELSQIDATKYPDSIRGIEIRPKIVSIKNVSHELALKSPEFKELFNAMPSLMGLDKPKVYMVQMANNYELRMSGGFDTYLVLFKLDKGVPEILSSIDTYDIDRDQFFMVNFNVPYYMQDYLKVTRLYARDATSTSPDFVVASGKFLNEFWRKNSALYQKLDGMIQVDNHVVEDLLAVLGPVDSGGFSVKTDQGNYIGISVKEFNSDNVSLELEKIAGGSLKEVIGRKDIIKFLMNSIMQKTLNASSENIVPLAETFLNLLGSKDIMIYSFDPSIQTALEDLNYSGRIVDTKDNTWDYLHVNNSNFGAGKRDWIVKRQVSKEVYEESGKKISVVRMTVVNPKSPSWWEWAGFYNDFFRFYVPYGSKMMEVTASDGQQLNAKEISDVGKTAFEGFFKMPEDSTITITCKYELPDSVDLGNYHLLIQKQPGTRGDIYEVKDGSFGERFELSSDKVVINTK